MHDPGLPRDYTAQLARRSVEEEQGLSPQPPEHPLALRLFAAVVVLGAIASVAYVAISAG